MKFVERDKRVNKDSRCISIFDPLPLVSTSGVVEARNTRFEWQLREGKERERGGEGNFYAARFYDVQTLHGRLYPWKSRIPWIYAWKCDNHVFNSLAVRNWIINRSLFFSETVSVKYTHFIAVSSTRVINKERKDSNRAISSFLFKRILSKYLHILISPQNPPSRQLIE